jgi:hypothetical protein
MEVDFKETGQTAMTKRKPLPKFDEVFRQDQKPESTGAMSVTRKRPGIDRISVYVPHSVYEQLRKLAFEERRKLNDYALEGFDRVFTNRGLPGIKELPKDQ